jgi:hypothetical protein
MTWEQRTGTAWTPKRGPSWGGSSGEAWDSYPSAPTYVEPEPEPPSEWTPAELTGLVGWWDLTALGLANDATIDSIPDLSGNGRTMDQSSGSKPVFKTASFAGLGSGFFTSGKVIGESALTGTAVAQPLTMVSVWRLDTTNTTSSHQVLGKYADSGSLSTPTLTRVTNTASNVIRLGAGSNIDGPPVTDTDPHYVLGIVRNATPRLYLDSSDVTPVGSVGARRLRAGQVRDPVIRRALLFLADVLLGFTIAVVGMTLLRAIFY